ncbi:hypothetical protein DFP72DRAFT_800579, partial [Ephemerocybe angulata]
SDSQYTIDAVSKHAQRWLDEGFIGVANKHIIQALVGELMATKAEVRLRKVKGHSGDAGNDGADALAGEGARKDDPDDVDLSKGIAIRCLGAATTALTQSKAYRAIREFGPSEPRRRTERMLERTKAVVEELTDTRPTTAAIWNSLKRRKGATLTQKFSAYAWRTLHDGYKLGWYWENITALRNDRMPCRQCEAPVETMDHILRECTVSGQAVVWELAKELWAVTGLDWPYTANLVSC